MPAARTGHRNLGSRHLPLVGVAAELHHRLVDEAVTVGTTPGELPTVGVEGKRPSERYSLTALDEGTALAGAAEAQRLEPGEAVEAETVVQAGQVDVVGCEIGRASCRERV